MKIQFATIAAIVLGVTMIGLRTEAADVAAASLKMPEFARQDTNLPQELAANEEAQAAPPAPVAGTSAKQPAAQAATPAASEPAATAADCADKPWTLPEPCALQELGIKQYGWLEQGATFNSLSPRDRWNGPVFTNDRSNEYEMNQLWLGWERPVKTDGCGFDIGGRIDLVYGTDWRYGDCYGLESRFDAPHDFYGMIIPQFYLETAYNDLTVKTGHYAPSIGYEVVAAPGNFFYSHSYALGYSEPVLVTGVQADYKLNDNWNVIGGFHEGFNQFEDLNDKLHFLGGLKWHSDCSKTSLSFMTDVGPQDPAGENDQYVCVTVLKQQIGPKWLYAAEQYLGGTEHGDPSTGGYARWYGLDQYLIYTVNKCWSFGTRLEFFRDEEGSRVAGVSNLSAEFTGTPGFGWTGAPGFAGTFTEATIGLNWHPNANFILRPELRWDCYDGSRNLQNQLPFGDGNRSSQFLFATDLIFTF
ncbi:MAG: outer membrane beta-barrel protein [Thermoguttaceae bacterium]|jgi:hypothetical protein